MQLHYRELKVHLVVFLDLEAIQFLEDAEYILDVAGDARAHLRGEAHIYRGTIEDSPEVHYGRAQRLHAQVELFVQLIHLYEVLAIEVAFQLALLLIQLHPLDFCDLIKQVLLVQVVAALVDFGQLSLVEGAHLKDAEHLLLLVLQREEVRE